MPPKHKARPFIFCSNLLNFQQKCKSSPSWVYQVLANLAQKYNAYLYQILAHLGQKYNTPCEFINFSVIPVPTKILNHYLFPVFFSSSCSTDQVIQTESVISSQGVPTIPSTDVATFMEFVFSCRPILQGWIIKFMIVWWIAHTYSCVVNCSHFPSCWEFHALPLV